MARFEMARFEYNFLWGKIQSGPGLANYALSNISQTDLHIIFDLKHKENGRNHTVTTFMEFNEFPK